MLAARQVSLTKLPPLLLLLSPLCGAIRVLQSEVRLDDSREGVAISGARLDDGRRVRMDDFTVCTRFKMKILGGHESFSHLWTIADHREDKSQVGLKSWKGGGGNKLLVEKKKLNFFSSIQKWSSCLVK